MMRLRDALGVRLLRLGLRLVGNKSAWRFYAIQRSYWCGPDGMRLIREMQAGRRP